MKGWVKVFSYTQPREAILDYPHWFLEREGSWCRMTVAEGQQHGKGVIARLEGIADRDEAAKIIASAIVVERDALPAVEDGQYYWADLEGLKVLHRDGTELGRVAYLLETGANDVLVTDATPERLIPFVSGDVVLDVDLAAGVITVDWDLD